VGTLEIEIDGRVITANKGVLFSYLKTAIFTSALQISQDLSILFIRLIGKSSKLARDLQQTGRWISGTACGFPEINACDITSLPV
jgi:hypothetical protein